MDTNVNTLYILGKIKQMSKLKQKKRMHALKDKRYKLIEEAISKPIFLTKLEA